MNWLRLYHSTLTSPKIQKLPDNEFKAWVNMLIVSSMRDPRGSLPEIEDLAFSLRLRSDFVARLVAKFERSSLVDVVNGVRYMHDWDHHQFDSDNINQRVKRFREAKRNVTCNAPEQIQNRTDTEQISLPADAGNEKAPPVVDPEEQSLFSGEPSPRSSAKEPASQAKVRSIATGTRFTLDSPPADWVPWSIVTFSWNQRYADDVFARFSDYWGSLPGARARKTDWFKTWRNWCRKEAEKTAVGTPQYQRPAPRELAHKPYVDPYAHLEALREKT